MAPVPRSPPRGDPVRISIGLDESIAKAAERGMAIRLYEALKTKYPDKLRQFSLRKNQKRIICEETWKTIAHVTYDRDRRQPIANFDLEIAKGLDPQFDPQQIIDDSDRLRRSYARV